MKKSDIKKELSKNAKKKDQINDPNFLIAKTGIIFEHFDVCEKEEGRQVDFNHLVNFAVMNINFQLEFYEKRTSKKEVISILNELDRIGIIHYPKKGLIARGADYTKI